MTEDEADRTMRRFHELVLLERYEEAWPLYEARRRQARFSRNFVEPLATYPEWTGQDVAGKRVLVVAEQGLGDQLMFGRYLPALAARGADITVLCNPFFLARTFEAAGYLTRPFVVDRAAPPADYWVFFGSLPLRLGLCELPPATYVPIPPTSGGGVGVVTNGSPTNWNDQRRSLTPETAADLLDLGRNLSPEATGAMDFYDTALIVAGLDLVITVDTALAHLAGALGKPCWVLLPQHGLDWRWGDGRRSPWYPDMRLFRQAQDGDWAEVLARVQAALADRNPMADAATCMGAGSDARPS